MTRASRRDLPIVGLMPGDWTGIGPEQCARILADGRLSAVARLIVVGDGRVLAAGARDAGVAVTARAYPSVDAVDWDHPDAPVLDLHNLDPASIPRGAVSAESGRITGETLAAMVRLAREGRIDGITFAPLNKAALHAGGWKFNDEHQLFANLLGHRGYFSEMNVLDDVWVSRVTSHVSLREALDQITPERIAQAIALVDGTMRGAGVARPRVAVAALNPHGGEGGLFGREEIDVIRPAVEEAVRRGTLVRGPFPADTIFRRAFAGEFDGVVAMYHDQGQIATKLEGFDRGVTLTAGLETVFTTPAHGTAFDIVGKGVASTGALERAVRLCASLASSRKRAPSAAPPQQGPTLSS